jgi:hypothetical protein
MKDGGDRNHINVMEVESDDGGRQDRMSAQAPEGGQEAQAPPVRDDRSSGCSRRPMMDVQWIRYWSTT